MSSYSRYQISPKANRPERSVIVGKCCRAQI